MPAMSCLKKIEALYLFLFFLIGKIAKAVNHFIIFVFDSYFYFFELSITFII